MGSPSSRQTHGTSAAPLPNPLQPLTPPLRSPHRMLLARSSTTTPHPPNYASCALSTPPLYICSSRPQRRSRSCRATRSRRYVHEIYHEIYAPPRPSNPPGVSAPSSSSASPLPAPSSHRSRRANCMQQVEHRAVCFVGQDRSGCSPKGRASSSPPVKPGPCQVSAGYIPTSEARPWLDKALTSEDVRTRAAPTRIGGTRAR